MRKSSKFVLVFVTCAAGALSGRAMAMAQGSGSSASPGSPGSPGAEGMPMPAPRPLAAEEKLVTIPVTAEEIDKKNRTLVVRTADGERVKMNVPPADKSFDSLKKGDKIEVDYYRSIAVAVIPGAAAGSTPTRTTTSGNGSRQVTASAEIMAVNRQDNTVQIKGPEGNVQNVAVQNPSVQRRLQDVKPGDMVQITYTEAVAAAIRPSRSK